MSDNLKKVWGSLQKVGYAVPEYNQFEKDMENEDNLKKVYGSLQKVGYEVPEYGKFKTDMGSIRSQGEGSVIEQPATPVVSSSVKNEEPESSFEPKEDWGKVAQDSLSRGVKKPVDVSTAANNEDGGLPRGHKMIDGQEYITGFGPAFAQGADQLYQGGKGLVGEAANLVTGSSMDERSALATLSSKTNANEELGNEDWFLKRWQSEFQGWDAKSDKEKKALRRDYMADYQHRLQQLTSDLVGQEYTASNGKTKKYGIRDAYDIAKKQLADEQRILEALKESRGDVHEAANALSEAVANPSWGDKIIDEVNQKNTEYLPTKGFAAYMGNLAPQMIPNAAAIGLMATGNPIAGNVIGKIGMGALTASTAGQSMAEASANGATPWQTASIGLADSAIEYLSELIPFSTYTGKLAKLSKRQLSKELAQALDTPAGREELKNLYLKANKDLGSKLFSKEFGKMYVSDVAAEGLSEFVAEGLETVTPMIYQNPEEYPVLAEVLNNGLEGMKGGVAMGAFLGAASSTAVNKKRDAIRKANDKVTLAMVDTKGDGNQRICEVIGNAGEDQYLVFDGEEEIAVDKNSVTEPINYTYDEFKAGEINYKVDQSFDNGYNTTDPTVMAQKTKEYEIRRKKAAKALGMTEDEVENLDPRLLVELRDSDGLTRKQYNAALGFFRAQAAFNGMISEAQDRIESETNEMRKQVETRVNPTTGMIHPITLRPIGTEAGQQVYVVRGNVAYTEDGQIDKVNSDQDLWIIDAEGQQPRAIGLAEIESVSPAINPQQEIDEATDAIGNRIANEKEAAMTGKVEMPAGQAYTLEDGHNGVVVNQDEQNIYVAVQNEKGEIEQVAVPVATVQDAADAVGYAEAEKRINDEDAIEEEAEAHPVYDINERVTLTLEDGTPATATIIPSDSDPDVYDVILDERPESGDKIRQMTKQQLDESVVVRNNVEIQPMTKAEEQTTSEAPVQESAQVEVEEPQPTVEDTTPKDFRGNAIPLNEDGSVRQSELFNNDPEAWAKWNDEKHADNGANSAKYIAAAEKNAQTQLDQMRAAYDEEMDFDKRDAMESEMKALEGKINTYKTIAENYRTGEGQLFSRVDGATKPRNAVYTDVANAAVGMTRKYGNKVQFITSIEDLGKLEASEKNGALQVIQSGQQVRGWYNPASGEAYIYLPDVESVEALNKVVTHEVLTHKGLRELMGEEAYKKYCEDVYRKVMTPAQRHFFYDVYNEGRLDEAAAGDEFLAHMAQATDLTAEQEKSLWGKIADKVKSVFKGDETIDFGTDDDFIAKLLKTSYANTIRDVNLEESYKAMKDYIAKYKGDAEDRKDDEKATEEPQDAETKVVGGSEESRMSKLTGEEDGIRFSKEDLGTPFYQFKGDAKGAIEFLKARKEGQAVAALHHRDIGDIDLVWGREGTGDSDGYGLAKLIKYHPEVLDNLQEILDNSTIVKRGENRIKLDSPKYATTVSLNWHGVDKKWLLTSYEKKNSVLDNTMNTGETISGKRNDTPTPQNTVSESKDTNSQEENNTLLSKIDNVDRAIAMTTGRDANEVRQERIQKESEKNQKIASLAKDEKISEETAKGLIDRGMNMNGGIAMSQEASDLKDATGYLTPEETGYGFIPEDIRFSHGMFDEWVAIHKTLNQAKKSYIRAISAFNDRVLADEAIKDIVSTAKYPKLDKMGPLRENVEYVFTFDLDLTCPRTFQYAYISSEIEKRMGRPLKTIEAQQLMELMRAYVQEIPCTYCYCENKRQDMKNYYISWTEARNKVFAAKTRKEAEDAMYKDGSGKMTDTAKNKVLPRWIKLAKQGAYNPTIEQLYKDHEDARNAVLTWLDGNIPTDKKSLSLSDEKVAEKVMKGMGMQNKDAGKVVEEFVSEWKWYKIEGKTIPGYTQAEAKPILEDALTIWREMTSYAKSATSAKLSARYLPYVGNLMNVSEKDKNHINAIGGLRMHSSNDFRIDYVIDYFQLIADMDANQWKGHCYTKSELFARLFGKTGYRINMSLAAYGGENGTPVTMNELEGMNWEAAKALRNENCGTMFMAVNDAQLQWALDQDWIDMIIPFHASGLRKEYWYDMRAWDNYQAKQNETGYTTEQKKEVLRERGIEFPEKANKDAIAAIFEEKVEYPHVYTKRGETISQKAPHFLPGEDVVYDKDGNEIPLPAHDNSTEKYLELCRQYMVNPRFYNVEGITYNGKPVNITEHPGYIKLIKETAATDTPQGPVKFNLDQPSERTDGLSPIDYAFNELKAHAERGGWDNKKVDPHNIINEFLREYVRYAEVTGEDRPLKYLTPRARMTYDYIQKGTFEHSNTDVPYHPSTQTDAEFERALQAENEREAKGAENLTKEDFRYSKTYHGSGADFKEFDTKFMSTGEGNQAYGWGTYVTTNEQTGRRYAEVSSATPTGAAKADASAKDIVAAQIYDIMDKDPLKTFDEAKKEILDTEDSRYTKDDVNTFKESDLGKYGPRHLYEVEIPDDNGFNYLHWDAPMTMKQAKAIQDEIAKQYEDELKETYGDDYIKEIKSAIGYGTEGSHVEGGLNYLLGNMMDYSTGIDRGAERNSKLLSDAGIVGMEVAVDRRNGSRYAGSNYVIYNTKDAQITAHTRFSKANADQAMFVSNAEQAVNSLNMGKASGEQWIKAIQGRGGLKAGEDKWIGLSQWLSEQTKPVTKDEVLKFIDENKIRIEEQKYSQSWSDKEIAQQVSSDKEGVKVSLAALSIAEKKSFQEKVSSITNGRSIDIGERAEKIQAMKPLGIKKTEVSKDDFKHIIQSAEFVASDGLKAEMTGESINKLYVPVLNQEGVLFNIKKLFENSVFAYSQPGYLNYGDGHKVRENVIEYLNYVTKFNNGKEYYCRFTVERFSEGLLVSHGGNIVEVEIIEKSVQDSLSALAEHQPLRNIERTSDTKLLNFFVFANTGEFLSSEGKYYIPKNDDKGSDHADEERRNSPAMENEDVPRKEQIVLYSKVTDPDLIKKLDSEPVEEWYGSMTWLNPEETDKSKWMFVPVKSAKDSKGQLREASSIDQWEQSEEDPEGLKSGKYDLKDVDNDVVGGVNYNPYFHVSNSLMNDQFTGAYNKPNTVVVKFLVPKSELYPEGEAYHAEGAKNHVGVLPWHSGTINAKLPADKRRSVALTRWRKPIGIASNEEVAKFIATKLKEANTSMPWNLVTPGVLAELDKIGAPISEGAGSVKMKGVPRPIERYSRVPVDISGATIKDAPIRLTSSNGIRLDKPFSGIKGNTEVIREVRVDFEPGNLGSVSVEKSIGGHAIIFGPFKYEAEGKGFRFIPDGEIITKDEDGLLYLHPGKVSEQLFDILGQIAEYKNRGAVRFSRLSSDGLRKLSDKFNSEAYDKFARDVFFTDEDARKNIINLAKGMDWNFLKASKEYLASLADVWEPSDSDRKIYDKVRELYDKPLTDEEARYLMWRKGDREKGAFGVAEDIVMQKNLEVGDFKNDGVQLSKFSIFGNNGKRSQQNSDGRSEGIIRSAVAGDPARKLAIRRDLGDIQGYRDGLAARSSEYSLLDSQIEKERFVSETLVNRAKEAGQYIVWDKAEEMGLPFKGKTMESLVMKDGNRVVKLKDPFAASAIKGNEPIDAIIEHVVHNILFPNTPYKFLGITEDYKGDMRFVLEQPFIKSIEEADQNDVVDFLENNLGLRDEGREQYGNNFVSVIDAFGENVLIDEDGELNFIDPIIKLKGNGDGVIKELLGEDNTMFSKSVGQAADRYNEAVRVINKKGEKKATANLFWRMKEAYLDSMKALKELQNAIAEETGKPIKDFENAYIAENAMSSKNQAGADEFQANYMTRILDALKDLYRVGRTQKDIVEYLIAKHGLERNEIFQQREEAKLRKELGEKLSQLDETADGYQQRHDELLYEYEQKILNTHKDYSGLTDLTGSKDDYTERARRIVQVFEGTNPEGTARLWRAINAATKRTLEINYEAGLLDKEAYENLRGMFKYYIPLRGWDSDVASHEYNYLGGDGPLREKTIKTAEGRTSVSDDPIATINKMAYDAIALANRNLMKQKLLNLAENHPTNLLRVSEQWYTKNAATGEWEGASPDIPEDATGEEITRIIDEFESRMKQAEADGNAKRQRNGLTLSKHATGFEKKEHEVRVRRAGKEYVIYVNGNPRAAQAVNGLTNPSNDPSVIKQGLQNIKNLMAQAFTSKNPAFIFANLSRDSLFAASSVFAKESGSYTAQYVRNYARNLKKMTGLVRKLNNGTLDESSLIERYFHEFVKNGGETGYTNIVTVDSYKKKLKRLEKEIRNGAAGQLPKKAWDGIWDGVEFLNRSAEDVTRFAVYMTSRQMGRSVARSVYDAKEVTVNFNKKGSGGYLAQQMNFAYIFFNACVQSAANLGRLIKSHPGKMGAIFGTYLAGGMLQPMLITALQEALGHGDDDDDKSYWDLPEWVRRNNLIFWVPFTNMYINIPLPQELRPLFGIGEIAASVAFDKENINDGIAKGAEGLSGIMPIDLTGNGGNMAINFTPTALQPVAQLIANKDFFGVPIYKKNEFNKENPDWTKAYKGTSSVLVNGTKWLSNITGGDNVVKGNVDLNPAIIEHLFEGYLGGLGKTLNKSAKSIMMLAGNEDWNMRNVPIASSFVQVPDERNTGSQTNREYYNLLDEYKEAQHKYNGYVNQLKREGGVYWDEYAKKIDEYTNTEDYARFMKMKPYVNAIDRLNTMKKNLPQDMVEEVDKQIADLKKEMISKMKGNE